MTNDCLTPKEREAVAAACRPFAAAAKRVVIHWTAGTYEPTTDDCRHYHLIVSPTGIHRVPHAPGRWPQHVRNLNTGSIGIAMACCHGALGPAAWGRFPPTVDLWTRTLDAASVAVETCGLTSSDVLTHCDITNPPQRGKWDVSDLPFTTEKPLTLARRYVHHKLLEMRSKTPGRSEVGT